MRTRRWIPWFQRLRRRWFVLAGLVLSSLTTAALVGIMLTRGVPIWWRRVMPDDPGTIELGSALENGVVRQFSAVREPDQAAATWRSLPWAVSLHAKDANAWMATRLPKWLANQGAGVMLPPEVEEIQIEFADDAVKLGMRVRTRGRNQVLSAEIVPDLREDGSLWLPASWVRIGRLPVPASWVLGRIDDESGYLPASLVERPEMREMLAIFLGKKPAVNEAVIGVDNARRVRLLRIVPRDGRLELTARTEAR